jgi:uncharacterized protein
LEVSRFNQLLEVLASQSGCLLNIAELSNTCNLARQTVERYLFLLEQTYIIRLVRPFSRNLRVEVTKTPKIFFYDTGLQQMLWLKRLQKELLGLVFETSLFAEFAKLMSVENVTFWRTTDKKEIDFVIKRPERPLPVEVKNQFPRTVPAVFKSFWRTTELEAGTPFFIVGLYGGPTDQRMIFPWEIYRALA